MHSFSCRSVSAHTCDGGAREFDIAHLHAWRNAPAAIAAHHLRKAGVPYIVAPNGTLPIIERRRLAKRVFDAVIGTRLLAGARRLLAVSEAERRQLLGLGISHEDIRLVANPVDLGEFAPPPQRGVFRNAIGHGGGPLVVFLGKLTPRKRADLLVRAFGRLDRPDARLVIAGNDMGAGQSVMALARALDVEGRTLFTGLLRGRARLEALADADVVVYPSQDEVFGLVPIEALLAGTPVVVADDCGCGEVVSACGGGQVVTLGDVEALARAIDRVLACPRPWRAAAAAAAARIRRMYARDEICAQLEALYAEVVATA